MAQSKFSYSIRAILIATGYMALAVASLVHPTRTWLGVIFGITVAMLFFSLLGMIYRTDRARAFWTGFALFGIGYMGMIVGPLPRLSTNLPTTLVLEYSLEKFHGSASPSGTSRYYPSSLITYTPPVSSTPPAPYSPAPSYSPIGIPTTATSPTSSDSSLDSEPPRDELPDNDEEDAPVSPAEPIWHAPSSPGPPQTTFAPSYPPPSLNAPSYNPSPYPSAPVVPYSMDAYNYFTAIGQAEFTMLIAAIGGWMAQFMFASRAGKGEAKG